MNEAKAARLVTKIASLDRAEEPSISQLLDECPELTSCGWINVLGPSEWNTIAGNYATSKLEWLIRVLITAERELNWIGGSVAASIWLFRLYQLRVDGDPDSLADWMLRKSGNKWVPFGSYTAAQSLGEWRDEQSRNARQYAAHAERQADEQKTREERSLERQSRASQRKNDAQVRNQALAILIERFERMEPVERLTFLAGIERVPLDAIPEALIADALNAVSQMTDEAQTSLLRRIDRRRRGTWGRLRSLLQERS